MTLEKRIIESIRDVPDFPKPGIVFKDITPLLKDVELSADITTALAEYWISKEIDVIIGIESRGFIWGNALAQKMKIPFVPIRKKGKLPAETHAFKYDLEYGSAEVEIHKDALREGQRALIHDDLLATGGTAIAAAELVKISRGVVAGFSFLVELGFLKGLDPLRKYSNDIHSLITY
ncbi:adenine phosphoribosyltransferase [Ekhidna lutea]|uniref:Adenine phosphoribosyltransferase n=1 Tax=Ekhidna lutea TaxID=447679 RepID=A0A239H652_EKHLU|nr:adenine phosphoribosyltransferase [Ekhidna lutea]SNS76899.1 adenine phosphoribosyltransferase [Ekhidna lutea]